MRAKLTELNNEVRKEIVRVLCVLCLPALIDGLRKQSTSTLALHPEEVALFVQMFDYLAAVTGGRKSPSQIVPNEQHIEALIHVLDRWPAIHRFPRA